MSIQTENEDEDFSLSGRETGPDIYFTVLKILIIVFILSGVFALILTK